MLVYYNEIDPFCVDWLWNLMQAGVIPEGVIDDRSIEDVKPNELYPFDQCHFFAGIGVWAYAVRRSGWGDRPIWTGSCPCQPFSQAGKGKGFADERHVWPNWLHLIRVCRPQCVVGEQVASKDGLTWLDLVQTDLEGEGYAVGATDTCAAGFGAPHIRQRLYWVAYLPGERCGETRDGSGSSAQRAGDGRESSGMDDSETTERGRMSTEYTGRRTPEIGGSGGITQSLATPLVPRLEGHGRLGEVTILQGRKGEDGHRPATGGAGPTNGFWRDAKWLPCIDGKARPTQSRSEPLDDGIANYLGFVRSKDHYTLSPLIQKTENRVGRLRGYGNCIVAIQATEFIRSVMECFGINEQEPVNVNQ